MEEETCSARCVLMISPLVKTEITRSECIPLIRIRVTGSILNYSHTTKERVS